MDTIQFYAIATGGSNTPLPIVRFITHMANTHPQTRPAPNDCSETSIPRALDLGAGLISADYLAASLFCLSFRAFNVVQVSVHTRGNH